MSSTFPVGINNRKFDFSSSAAYTAMHGHVNFIITAVRLYTYYISDQACKNRAYCYLHTNFSLTFEL